MGGQERPIRVGVMLGSRANAWHSDVFRHLPEGFAVSIVGTTRPRYPLAELAFPYLALPYENEVGSFLRRRLLNLRYRLTHRRSGFEFRLAPAAGQLAGFDVLDSWELFTEWTWSALEERARRAVPVVLTVWDNLLGHFAGDPRRAAIRRRALAEADRFHVFTEGSEAMLVLEGVDRRRILRGGPSVDLERFRPGPAEQGRQHLDARADDVLVLCVARLAPEKGLRHLLEALALALPAAPALQLRVIGEGPERAPLEELGRSLGLGAHLRFTGELPHARMPELMRAADLLVLPSLPTPEWQEQWGQCLLEGMASGVACIASQTGGIPEVLGDAGVRVAPGDALALARALARLAGGPDERRALGEAGRKRAAERFSHPRQARVLAALYRDLLGPPGGGRE